MTSERDNQNCVDHMHTVDLVRKMQAQRDNQQFCDVVLVAGEDLQRIDCHRCLLSACSKYFEVMFNSSMLEADAQEVKLAEMHGDYLRPLVDFCYSGEIDIVSETVEGLLRASHRLQLPGVVAKCEEFMKRNLAADNCLGVAAIADQLDLATLKRDADVYICEKFVLVCRNQEFLELTVEQVSKLIASDVLTVFSEDAIFKSVMTWVQHDSENRAKHTSQLLELVRMPLLSGQFLMEHAWNFCTDSGCIQMLKELIWKIVPTKHTELKRANPRQQFKENILVVSPLAVMNNGLGIQRYCPLLDEWSFVGKVNLWRDFFSIAILKDQLIILGGDINNNSTSIVESYDVHTNICKPLNPMLTKRKCFGVAVLEGLLYAVGGKDDNNKNLNSVERYNPDSGDWIYVDTMKNERTVEVAVLEGRLYAVGDHNRTTESFDPKTDRWTIRADRNEVCADVGVAAGGGFLYVLGGGYWKDNKPEAVSSVERYDPRKDEWTNICALSSPGWHISCAFLGDRLMAFGGCNNDKYTNAVECYNDKTNTWSQKKSMEESSFVKCAVLLRN